MILMVGQSPDEDSPERPRTEARSERSTDDALSVDAVIVEEHRRWAVDIVVVFADGVVRHRISVHPSRRLAEISADLIRRTAERNIRGPLNGSS